MSKAEYYSEADHGPHEYYRTRQLPVGEWFTLPNARIAYKTHGTLNAAKDNVVLFPHMWSGTPKAMEIFIGEDRPLDPRKYFIILPGQFANGFSLRQATRRRRSMAMPSRMSPSVTMSWRAPSDHRALRHPAAGTGARLVDGCRTDLRMGSALPGYGQARAAVCRYGQDHAARLLFRSVA